MSVVGSVVGTREVFLVASAAGLLTVTLVNSLAVRTIQYNLFGDQVYKEDIDRVESRYW